jgi:hypothetical protein
MKNPVGMPRFSEFSKIIPSGQEHGPLVPQTRSINRKYASKYNPGAQSILVGSTITFQMDPVRNGFEVASGSMSQSGESIAVKCKLPPCTGDPNRTNEVVGLFTYYSDNLESDAVCLDVIIDHSHRVVDSRFWR